jgi:predicted transcriptional regulator
MNNKKLQVSTGLLSLLALLTYTLIHTGGLLSRYIHPEIGGYIAAFGIELTIVSLSLRIGELRRYKQDSRFFLFVLMAVVLVSALANIAEGFFTNRGELLTVLNVSSLDPIQAIIGLCATGLISLIVLALSEIIGTDVQSIVYETEKRNRKEQKTTVLDTIPVQFETSVEQSRETKEERIKAIVDTYRDNPKAKPVEIYRQLNIPRPTFYAYQNELIEDGIIEKNGTGVKVIG